MRCVTAFLLVAVLSANGLAAPPPVTDVDRVVAVVNNDVITANELEKRMAEARQQLDAQKIKPPPEDVLRRQLLERLVAEQIQLQLATQTGIRVTDQDVDPAIATIAGRNKMTVDALYDVVRRQGLDRAEYREQIRNQLAIQQLVDREVNNQVTVSESEVNNFLENNRLRAGRDAEYNVSHIFIPVPESASPQQIQTTQQRAENVVRQLRAGEDFARAAVTHSQGPEALKGGALGWRGVGQLPELFLAALEKLKPGDVSDALRGPNGFHILKLNDRRGGTVADEPVQETHVRHILLRPSEIQSINDARTTLTQLRERIVNGEDFATLARTYSEDTVSAANGGDLGWVRPKQLVPPFERAMNALEPGAVSEPVQTPFGLHLIQVLGRRVQTIAGERERIAAREQIHARKAEDRYEQWLRQLRDEAYVEYMLDEPE
ncbi:MAG: peptidylprolyl isomerase [Sulfurifustis sp.]